MALCKHCCRFANIIPGFLASDQHPLHMEHQPNWTSLVDSALICNMCAMIKTVLQLYVDTSVRLPDTDQPIDLTLMYECDVDIRIRGHNTPANLLYLYPPKVQDSMFLRSFIPRRPIQHPMDLETSIQFTKYWLQNCCDHHESCKLEFSTSHEYPALPTRVLDVGSTEPFLFNSKGRRSLYVALSHCWGGCTFDLTTRSSIEEKETSIPIASMSRTLQDAVLLTRGLGFRYLWVDYLCIVQDDAADWERESSQMGAIYSHASLTIAAVAASDGTQGLLIPRREPLDPVRIPIADGQDTVYMAPNSAFYEYGVEPADLRPLQTRAWTLQESILSRRMVGFEREEMVWECNETRQSESRFSSDRSGYPSSKEIIRMNMTDLNSHSFHAKWCSLVETYSERNLTFSKDKLPAISGVARLFSEADYLAGIWNSHLLEELLWTCVTACVPEGYRAPSWSWASIDGPIRMNWQFTGLEACVKVLDVATEPLLNDSFGQLRSAHLTLFGRIKEAKCGCKSSESPCRYYEYRPPSPGIPEGTTQMFLDANGQVYSMRRAPSETEQCLLKFRLSLDGERASDDSICGMNDLKLCLIGFYEKSDSSRKKWMESLLLRPVAGRENTFERIGKWKSFEHLDFYEACVDTRFTLI